MAETSKTQQTPKRIQLPNSGCEFVSMFHNARNNEATVLYRQKPGIHRQVLTSIDAYLPTLDCRVKCQRLEE